jgi:hypothetical protein
MPQFTTRPYGISGLEAEVEIGSSASLRNQSLSALAHLSTIYRSSALLLVTKRHSPAMGVVPGRLVRRLRHKI